MGMLKAVHDRVFGTDEYRASRADGGDTANAPAEREARFTRTEEPVRQETAAPATATHAATDAPHATTGTPPQAHAGDVATERTSAGTAAAATTTRVPSMARSAVARRRQRRGATYGAGAAGGASATGAAATTDRKRRRGGWLLPLLGLLLLLGLLALAFGLFSGGGDEPKKAPAPAQQPAPSGGTDATPLRIGARTVQAGAPLGDLVGREARVTGARVVQVDGNGGFWIGGSGAQRVFVEYGPAAGVDEATAMPKVGDTVNLTGPIAEPPQQPGRTFHIPVSSERVILEQGGYINADRVTQAR